MSNISVNACRDTDYAGEQEVSITANEIKITPVKAENDKVNIVASNKDGKSEQLEITLKSSNAYTYDNKVTKQQCRQRQYFINGRTKDFAYTSG